MHTTKESATGFSITAVCTVTDPVERKRRLAQAYGVIIDLARQKKIAAQDTRNALSRASD